MEWRLKHFQKICEGIDVEPLRQQIAAQPELWNQHPERLGGPFSGTGDIWCRFRPASELTSPERFGEPHFAEFYPAWHALPGLRPIVFDLMARTQAVYMGGILITRIPAGGSIKPHHDRGSWHAEFMNTKVYVGIQTNPQCVNYCEDESTVINAGDAVIFNNLLTHSVENSGDTDRWTLICCFRVEPLVASKLLVRYLI